MKLFDTLATGAVVVGVITAFAIHASDLTNLTSATGKTVSGLTGTVEKG